MTRPPDSSRSESRAVKVAGKILFPFRKGVKYPISESGGRNRELPSGGIY